MPEKSQQVSTAESGRLAAESVSVSFGAVRALEDVSLQIRRAEVHALCGENGAGKSTLIRCLGGAMRPSKGRITVDGGPLPADVRAAEAAGVAVIHQEPLAFPDLSAEDTIFVGREPALLGGAWLDRGRMRRRARDVLETLGERIDTRRAVGELALAQRQMVAIARALVTDCRFLILDEPTASLSAREAAALHRVVRGLAGRGVGVLWVSHRLAEVLELSQKVSVLRDGRLVATRPAAELSQPELVRMMVGRELAEADASPGPARTPGGARLEVTGLSRAGAFTEVTLTVRAGEIVGLAGLVGAGRSEAARAIAGVERAQRGAVRVEGRAIRPGRVRDAVRAGLVLVPEDRRDQGLVAPMPVATNIGLSDPPGLSRGGFIRPGRQRALAEDMVRRLQIKAAGTGAPVATLSGGNQQKVLLGKWLAHTPRVLLLDEPTRGVDVGAKAEIHGLIRRLAYSGAAVLLISSDLPEVLALSDRVLVMRQGRVVAEMDARHATPEAVLKLAVPAEVAPERPS